MGLKHKNRQRDGRDPRRLFSRFLADRNGATAIEFTMLAVPFAALVFAILETCISFAAQQVLSNATDDIARQIRTGQLRGQQIDTVDELEDLICARLQIIVSEDCPELEVDLQEYDTFAQAAAVRIKFISTADGKKLDTAGFEVTPGGKGTKNMLRVFYRWPVMTDLIRKSISNLAGGKTLLFASVTWQNEPFD